MRYPASQSKKRDRSIPLSDLATVLSEKLVGQPASDRRHSYPTFLMYRGAAVARGAGRRAVFLLLGPTGTGKKKTKTVEALADVLARQTPKKLLKVDCGEFQMDHESGQTDWRRHLVTWDIARPNPG